MQKTCSSKEGNTNTLAILGKENKSTYSFLGMIWHNRSVKYFLLFFPHMLVTFSTHAHQGPGKREALFTTGTWADCHSYPSDTLHWTQQWGATAPIHNSRPKLRSIHCTSSKTVCIYSQNTNMHRILKSLVLPKDGFCFLQVKKPGCNLQLFC